MDLKAALSVMAGKAEENAPAILTACAVAGIIATTVYTFKKSPKIQEIIAEKKRDLEDTAPNDKETKQVVVKEAVKELAPQVAPIIIFTGLSIACVIGAHKLHLGKEAALTTAFLTADRSLKEWKEAAKEKLEKKDYEKVEEAVLEKRINEAMESSEPPIKTGYGNYLCIDGPTGRMFYSNIDRINKIVGDVNSQLKDGYDDFITWNSFRRDLGLPSVSIGNELGFNVHDQVDVKYSTIFDDEANAPVLYLEYTPKPRFKWGDL